MILKCPHCDCDFDKQTQFYEVVTRLEYSVRPSKNNEELNMLMVKYHTESGKVVTEFVCFEHEGFALEQAKKWWDKRSMLKDVPKTSREALAQISFLFPVSLIGLRKKGEFLNVVEAREGNGRILTGRSENENDS